MADIRDIAGIFLTQCANLRTLPTNLTTLRCHQATQDAQQACFAAAVRSRELQERAGSKRETNAAKESPISADTFQVFDFQYGSASSRMT